MSCVHCVSEPEKSIQVWKCPEGNPPSSVRRTPPTAVLCQSLYPSLSQWSFGYLPACELLSEAFEVRSPKGKSPEPAPSVGGDDTEQGGVASQLNTLREQSTEESFIASSQ